MSNQSDESPLIVLDLGKAQHEKVVIGAQSPLERWENESRDSEPW